MGPPDEDDPDYKVGPGKPPVKDRWKPGQSGNPKGRPKKLKAAGTNEGSLTDLILSESKRQLTLTDRNGNPVTVIADKAIIMALTATAGKGNAYAIRTYIKLRLDAEAEREKARFLALQQAYELKLALQEFRDEWVAFGRAEGDMPLHPSDIEIEPTGEVRYYVALTDEEKAARVTLLIYLEEGHAALARYLVAVAEDGSDFFLEFRLDMAILKIICANVALPPRFRRPVPPGCTVSAKQAAIFRSCDLGPMEYLRPAITKKLGDCS